MILAVFSAIGYFVSKDGISKVKYYWLLNVFVLLNAPLLYLTMSCDMLWLLRIYFVYVAFAILFLLIMPKIYRAYLSRKYGVERFGEMEHLLKRWSSAKARLYIFGSAVPRAFTINKDVFISAGMVDLLDSEELKAIIAHEAFHVNQNRYPLFNNFKILTFILLPETKLEVSADFYAESIVGKKPLNSAKEKVRSFYLGTL
jgi:heat shock protein HtpX